MSDKAKELRDRAYEEEPGLMMTPMVDIVFQLLIFFMLACRFRTTEGRIESQLPKGIGPNTTAITESIPLNEIRIKLLWCRPDSYRETGNPANGRTVLKVGDIVFQNVTNTLGETEPDWKALYNLICSARDKYTPSRDHPTLPAVIDARKPVEFKHVVTALNECVRAGLKEIKFAAPEIPY
jgi:biopolymer transport protein ExbD